MRLQYVMCATMRTISIRWCFNWEEGRTHFCMPSLILFQHLDNTVFVALTSCCICKVKMSMSPYAWTNRKTVCTRVW